MGLLDQLNSLKNDWTPEKFSEAIIQHLQELEEGFECKDIGRIQSIIQTKSKYIRKDGETIFENLGLKGMQDVYALVKTATSSRTASNLSQIWDGTAKWCH